MFFNYPKLKTVCRDENSFLILKVKRRSVIKEELIRFTANKIHQGFLPIGWTKNKSAEYLTYDISNLVELSGYLSSGISDERFICIVSQIVDIIKACHTEGIPLDNILLRASSIYYDPSTQMISVICLPFSNTKKGGTSIKFFSDLYSKAVIHSTNKTALNKYCKIVSDSMQIQRDRSQEEAFFYFLQFFGTEIKNNSDNNTNHSVIENITMTAVATELLDSETETDSTEDIYSQTDSEHTILLEKDEEFPFLLGIGDVKTEITHFPFLIGRNPDNDLQLKVPTVSGTHAQITHESNKYYITDLNSGNGTFLNDPLSASRIRKSELCDGDHIYFYQTEVIFHTNEYASTVLCDEKDEETGDIYSSYTTQKYSPKNYTAYITCSETGINTSIFSFPFVHTDIHGIIFEEQCINGKKKYLIKNTSCDNAKVEGIPFDKGAGIELFSGCSFSVSDIQYSFFIVN